MSEPQISDGMKASIVKVSCGTQKGTAFFIDNSKLITASHVIKDSGDRNINIYFNDYNQKFKDKVLKCRVVDDSEDYDLAILEVEGEISDDDHITTINLSDLIPLNLRRGNVTSGKIWGYYDIEEVRLEPNNVTKGDEVLVDGYKANCVDSGYENFHGFSGGPVFSKGSVVGYVFQQKLNLISTRLYCRNFNLTFDFFKKNQLEYLIVDRYEPGEFNIKIYNWNIGNENKENFKVITPVLEFGIENDIKSREKIFNYLMQDLIPKEEMIPNDQPSSKLSGSFKPNYDFILFPEKFLSIKSVERSFKNISQLLTFGSIIHIGLSSDNWNEFNNGFLSISEIEEFIKKLQEKAGERFKEDFAKEDFELVDSWISYEKTKRGDNLFNIGLLVGMDETGKTRICIHPNIFELKHQQSNETKIISIVNLKDTFQIFPVFYPDYKDQIFELADLKKSEVKLFSVLCELQTQKLDPLNFKKDAVKTTFPEIYKDNVPIILFSQKTIVEELDRTIVRCSFSIFINFNIPIQMAKYLEKYNKHFEVLFNIEVDNEELREKCNNKNDLVFWVESNYAIKNQKDFKYYFKTFVIGHHLKILSSENFFSCFNFSYKKLIEYENPYIIHQKANIELNSSYEDY